MEGASLRATDRGATSEGGMKRWVTLIGVALMVGPALAAEDVSTCATNITLGSFELKDQHQRSHHFDFPRTNLFILTVADQKGSEQIAAWVRPLKERFPEGLPIEGVADVSSVPGLLRPLVRREFKNKFERPVMLDWSGDLVKQLNCQPGVANVFAVATNGALLWNSFGAAEANKLAELFRLVEAQHDRRSSLDVNPKGTAGGFSGKRRESSGQREPSR
jgi:hypothetical protein